MSKTPRKRGRPSTIDTDAAMQAIVELFRGKGFAAVSLDELSDATGLSRPSLYRAFGDKLSMYLSAFDAFGQQVVTHAVPALMDEPDLALALTGFYTEMLNIYFRDDTVEPGCLVYGTAPSSADIPAVRDRLHQSVEGIDDLMRTRFTSAALHCNASEIDTAVHLASNTLIAFSARSKSGAPKKELMRIGELSAQAIAALLEPLP